MYAPGGERALSLQDQRHRFTLSGLWALGPDLDDRQDQTSGPSTNPVMRALTGLEIAPIVTASSGFRANAITGLDSNLAHIYPFAARPLGYHRNELQTAPERRFRSAPVQDGPDLALTSRHCGGVIQPPQPHQRLVAQYGLRLREPSSAELQNAYRSFHCQAHPVLTRL